MSLTGADLDLILFAVRRERQICNVPKQYKKQLEYLEKKIRGELGSVEFHIKKNKKRALREK